MITSVESIDYWYQIMTGEESHLNDKMVENMFFALKQEYPRICSLIMERACNLQCAHCIFQLEKTTSAVSQAVGLTDLACNIISQYEPKPFVIHEGRILRDWHLSTFAAIRKVRPDAQIGLIDNGTYLNQERYFQENNILLDWMDISLDGTREVHNKQRKSPYAFDQAVKGLQNARDFITASGKLTSLFTVTSINYNNVYDTASFIFNNALAEEFHITPFSPVRTEIESLFFCPGYKEGKVDEAKIWWEQVQKVWGEFQNPEENKVFVRIYQHADLEKIARAVGPEKFIAAFRDKNKVYVDRGSISFVLDGVRITYVPLSICPSETFVIDVDGTYRMAYCLKYTLKELNSGRSIKGDDIRPYTVAQLTSHSSFKELFHQGVEQWHENFGYSYLKAEFQLFQEMKNL